MTTPHKPWRCWGCGAEAEPTRPCACGCTIAVHREPGRTQIVTPLGDPHAGHIHAGTDRRRGPLHGLWRWLRDRL